MIRVMFDLETFGTGPNSAIVQIGACVFPFPTSAGEEGETCFKRTINLQSCILAGFDIDQSTVDWWRQQSKEAVASISGKGVDIETALMAFDTWLLDLIEEDPDLELWAKGTDFDLALLKNAYHRLGLKPCFRYNCGRDVRTLLSIAKAAGHELPPAGPIAHDGLADSIAQAIEAVKALEYLAAK